MWVLGLVFLDGNRAAAYSHDGDHANAVEDSKKAIEVDPDYSKSYSRMGYYFLHYSKNFSVKKSY